MKKIRDNPGFQPFPESGRWKLPRALEGEGTAKDPAGFGGGDFNLYTYASNPTGLFAEICRTGNVVKIKLSIRYKGAFISEITEKWDRAIEKACSGKLGKYTVFTRVENPFFPGLALGSKWNIVKVDENVKTSSVAAHKTGKWRKNQSGNVAAHEAGHFMNVIDRYYPKDDPDPKKAGKTIPGYEGTLMGDPHRGGVNNEATISELLNNNDVKKCKSAGGCN